MLLGLDATVLYLVLPSLIAELGPSAGQTLWIVDAYGFFIAGFLISMGTLGDRVGRRRLLVIGVTAFGVVSLFAAFAPNAPALIVARALLGVAGATLMPSTVSLLSNMFVDARQRAVAIGVWVTTFALGMAAGPVVGGVLVTHLWWGAAFLLAVPIAAVVVLGAPALLPEYRAPHGKRLDVPSVALSLAAILPLVFTVKQLASGNGADLDTLTALPLGAVATALFVRRQLRLPDPLLDMTLFRSRVFSVALGVLLVGLVGVGGVMYLVTQHLQLVRGLDPVTAGLWMGPPALAALVSALGAPLVARRLRPGTVMAGTLALSLVGYALLATVGPDSTYGVVVGFAFVFLGLGAIAALGTDIVVGAAPLTKSGSAAALSETVQELGIAVGVALLGSLTTLLYRGGTVAPAEVSAEVAAQVTDSLPAAVAMSGGVPDATLDQAREAFTDGLNVAAGIAGLGIAGVTVLCALALRGVRPIGVEEDQP